MIYTFYSYKGGVGRSMALANVAELFYRAGLKVLMVDWDLEAPGLERFFPIDHQNFYQQQGVIDLLLNYQQKMTEELHISDDELPFEKPSQFAFDIYPDSSSQGKLWLLSAGKRANDFAGYANRVKNFDWKDFYENWAGEQYIEWLRFQFEVIADVVLIDSRTGISEMGGVCTYQFADVIVMLTTSNQQSLTGTHNMLLEFNLDLVVEARKRPLEIIVVPAKVEYSESNYLDSFQEEFIELFDQYIPKQLGSKRDRFWQLSIPYTPKYAYKERLAIPEKDKEHAKRLVEAFSKLASALSVFDWKENSPIRAAMPVTTIPADGGNLSRIQVTKDISLIDDNIYIEKKSHLTDWGNARDVENFIGRVRELFELEKWIIQDRCRLVAILGMGGIGKTDCSIELAHRIEKEFDYVIWRSLKEAPTISELLEDIVKYLSNQDIVIKDSLYRQLSHLGNYLRLNRCLLILDNVEAIFKGGETVGDYQDGYEGYGQFFRLIGETNHQSCLLLTSRETPREIAQLAEKKLLTRSIELRGLNVAEARELSESISNSLIGGDKDWKKLVKLYNGNPLGLELVVSYIEDFFGGNIVNFLEEKIFVIGDIRELLDENFKRLSNGEKEIMYWLAIEREPIIIQDLINNINMIDRGQSAIVPSQIQSLKRRFSLDERKGSKFTLHPVILEYITKRFIDEICQEIQIGKIELFNSHALIQATAKDYVRNIQTRLILKPIVNKLIIASFGSNQALEDRIRKILADMRETAPLRSGYAGGNILNLLVHLKFDLSGYDFSRLNICQAYLQDVKLHGVNFTGANFTKSSFLETFSSLLSVAFSPSDGKYLATGDVDGGIRIWRVKDLTQSDYVNAHSSWVRSIAFSPDGTMLASGSDDQIVKVWSFDRERGLLSQDLLATFSKHTYRVRSVAFNPQNNNMLASSSYDKTIRIWDIQTGTCQKILEGNEGHTDWIWMAIFTPDGSKLVSSSKDKTLKIWDVNTGKCISTWQVNNDIQSIAFSFDGTLLAAGCDDCTVKLCDFQKLLNSKQGRLEEHIKYLPARHSDYVRSVAFNKDGKLASAGYDNKIRLWNVRTGECTANLEKGHTHRLRAIAFSPDGKTLVSGGWDQTLKLWDIKEGNESLTLQSRTDWICGADISPDGKLLVSGGNEKIIKLWNIKGEVVDRLDDHKTWVWAVAFSPDGKSIASGSFDHTIKLWNSSNGKLLYTLSGDNGHKNWVWSIAFSPDGKLLASGGDESTVKIWDVATGQWWKDIPNQESGWTRSVAFSPDSKLLAVGSDDFQVRIWDIDNLSKPKKILLGHKQRVRSVAFSPDGKILASASYDRTIGIWATGTNKRPRFLEGHTDQVRSVAFSRNGNILASGGNDKTVRLWNPHTGECIKVLAGHTDEVRSVAFSRDADSLISSSKDGTIRLWDANTGDFIKHMREDRPYERMNITGTTGLTDLQTASLKALGAIE